MTDFIMPVPDRHDAAIRPLCEAMKSGMDALLAHLDRSEADSGAVDYAEFEDSAAGWAQAVERGMHAAALSKLDVDCDYVRVWGNAYRRVGRYEADYHSMAGTLRVERSIYRKVGERNGPTIDPVSLRAGVVEDGWLPRAAQAMAYLLAQGTSREAEETSVQIQRLEYSRSSFERVGHAVGALYTQANARIEKGLIEAYEVPKAARTLSVSIDRVSVPMEELLATKSTSAKMNQETLDLLASGRRQRVMAPRAAAAIEAQLAEARRHVVKVERNWRMAYCATVTLHDGDGEALHTIRYGRMPSGDVLGLMNGLARDIRALLAKQAKLRLVYLADGAKELWGLFDRHLAPRQVGATAHRMVDCWHAMEYLGSAALLLESQNKAWPGCFKRWRALMLERPGGRHQVLQELRDSGQQQARNQDGKPVVGDAIRYLESRLPMMRYAAARRAGLPIGSGQVEATCKSLVALRMKRPGARWKRDSGDEVLQLRALVLSDRWRPAMARSMSRLRKPVKALPRGEALAA